MDEKKTEDMIEEKTPETIEEPEAVEEIVPWLVEQGYQLVTINDLLAYGH